MPAKELRPLARVSPSGQSQQTQVCIKCGRELPLADFSANRKWTDNAGRDAWCKACIGRCASKVDAHKYCWENHREWDQAGWVASLDKARKTLAGNDTYIKSSQVRQQTLAERLAVQEYMAWLRLHYKFAANEQADELSYEQALQAGHVVEVADPNARTWSNEWGGNFTPRELESLNDSYARLEQDFSFNDSSMQDYARKVCRASMQVNKAMDDFAAGRCDYAAVKDAVAVFDMLSKSANFAACKRKQGDTAGITSWAETTYKLETTGHTMQTKIDWPQDRVDKCIEHLTHIVTCLNL